MEEAAVDPEADLAGSEHVAIFKRTRAALHMLNDMQVGVACARTCWWMNLHRDGRVRACGMRELGALPRHCDVAARPNGAASAPAEPFLGRICLLPAAAACQYAVHAAATAGGCLRCSARQEAAHEQRAGAAAGR